MKGKRFLILIVMVVIAAVFWLILELMNNANLHF